jgi:hypothetical protein
MTNGDLNARDEGLVRYDDRSAYEAPRIEEIVALQMVVMGSVDANGDSGSLGPRPPSP